MANDFKKFPLKILNLPSFQQLLKKECRSRASQLKNIRQQADPDQIRITFFPFNIVIDFICIK